MRGVTMKWIDVGGDRGSCTGEGRGASGYSTGREFIAN